MQVGHKSDQCFFRQFIKWLFDESKCFIDSFKIIDSLNISLIALKSKFFLSRSILVNLQPSFSIIVFVFPFHGQYFCHNDHFHQFLLRPYGHENTNQSCNLILCLNVFSLNELVILVSAGYSFVKMTSYSLNPNLFLF